MQVTLSDGAASRPTLVGSLPDDDIALIRIADASGLTPAELGSSADVRVGDDVVAIGNALNLGGPPSVTEGIISAKDRTIQAEDVTLRQPHPDRCRHQPGQLGRPAAQRGRPGGRHQHRDHRATAPEHRLRHRHRLDQAADRGDQAGQGHDHPGPAFLGVRTRSVGDAAPATSWTQYGISDHRRGLRRGDHARLAGGRRRACSSAT